MGRKNKLKVNLNNASSTSTTEVSIGNTTTTKVIDTLKNFPELVNKPTLEMTKLLQMSAKDNKDELDPIEKYNLENKEDNDNDDDDDEDDKMEEDDDNEENGEEDGDNKKKLTHREKFLLKRKIKNEVKDLKIERRKCKKTNFAQKKEKKYISKEIHEKISATLKKKKNKEL